MAIPFDLLSEARTAYVANARLVYRNVDDPRLDPIRSDGRFEDLVRKVGIPRPGKTATGKRLFQGRIKFATLVLRDERDKESLFDSRNRPEDPWIPTPSDPGASGL